jgi:hypothetical protein
LGLQVWLARAPIFLKMLFQPGAPPPPPFNERYESISKVGQKYHHLWTYARKWPSPVYVYSLVCGSDVKQWGDHIPHGHLPRCVWYTYDGRLSIYEESVLKRSKVSFREKCARTWRPLKLPSPTKLARLGHFPPASQAGRLAGPLFYTISFLWGRPRGKWTNPCLFGRRVKGCSKCLISEEACSRIHHTWYTYFRCEKSGHGYRPTLLFHTSSTHTERERGEGEECHATPHPLDIPSLLFLNAPAQLKNTKKMFRRHAWWNFSGS